MWVEGAYPGGLAHPHVLQRIVIKILIFGSKFGRAPKSATYISTCTCSPVICHQISKERGSQRKRKCLTGSFLTSLPWQRQPTGKRSWRYWRQGAWLSARWRTSTWALPSKSIMSCQRCWTWSRLKLEIKLPFFLHPDEKPHSWRTWPSPWPSGTRTWSRSQWRGLTTSRRPLITLVT